MLAVSAQIQIWSAPPAYDVGGRLLNAALAALYTVPLLFARRWPLTVLVVVLGAAASTTPWVATADSSGSPC